MGKNTNALLNVTELLKSRDYSEICRLISKGAITPANVVREYYDNIFVKEKNMTNSLIFLGMLPYEYDDEIAQTLIEIGDFKFAKGFLTQLDVHFEPFCKITVDSIVLLFEMYFDSDKSAYASRFSEIFNYLFMNDDIFRCALKKVAETDSAKLIFSFAWHAISCAGTNFKLKSEDIDLFADKLIKLGNIEVICGLVERLRFSANVIGEIGTIRDKLAQYVIDNGTVVDIYKVAGSLQGFQNNSMDALVQAIINLGDFKYLCSSVRFKTKVNQLFVAIIKSLEIETFPAEKIENVLMKLAEKGDFDINLLVDFLVYWAQQMAKGIDIFQEPISLEDDSIGGRQFVKEQVNPKGV